MAKLTDESDKILQHLRSSDPIEKAYFFYGDDSYVIEQAIKAIELKKFKGAPIDPLCWETYSANETPFQTVKDSLATISMFGDPKVVIYRDIEKLKDAERKAITELLENQPKRTHLVLTTSRTDITEAKDPKKSPWRYFIDNTHSACCPVLPDYKAAAWILEHARQYNLNFSRDAADMAAACTGGNRAMIVRALEKLQIAIKDGRTISAQDISQYVVDTRQRSVFELTDMLSFRNLAGAYGALRALLEQGQEPIAINGAIARHVRTLFHIRLDLDSRISDEEIMKKHHLTNYFFGKYKTGARNYSVDELRRFLEQICLTDRALKSSRIDSDLIIEKLLFAMIPAPSSR